MKLAIDNDNDDEEPEQVCMYVHMYVVCVVCYWQCQSGGSSSISAKATTSATSTGSTTTLDPRRIPGWEKVRQLADQAVTRANSARRMDTTEEGRSCSTESHM